MAKTSNPDIFAVTPKFAEAALAKRANKQRVFPWYLAGMTKPELLALTTVGHVHAINTKAGRNVLVVSTANVTDGSPVPFTHPVTGAHRVEIISKAPANA